MEESGQLALVIRIFTDRLLAPKACPPWWVALGNAECPTAKAVQLPGCRGARRGERLYNNSSHPLHSRFVPRTSSFGDQTAVVSSFGFRHSSFRRSDRRISYRLPGLGLGPGGGVGGGVGVGAGEANGSRATFTWLSARPNANKLPSGEYVTPVTYE